MRVFRDQGVFYCVYKTVVLKKEEGKNYESIREMLVKSVFIKDHGF